ncbi:MAG: 50S ribosomal protein L1 [Nevskiales bacterium]
MPKLSKRFKAVEGKIQPGKAYPLDEAITILKSVPPAKFRESVDVAVNLGIDAKKSDQVVRGSTVLPHGTGKNVRVAVFTQGANAQKAKDAGADLVGMADLAEQVQKGVINFDLVIATPDAMPVVGKLGTILGPKGLMPNPKVGTVTNDVAQAVKNAKAGQVQFRTDKAGIVHVVIGKLDFEKKALAENLQALMHDLLKARPASAKGIFLKKITISSTMGPGILVDQGGFGTAA